MWPKATFQKIPCRQIINQKKPPEKQHNAKARSLIEKECGRRPHSKKYPAGNYKLEETTRKEHKAQTRMHAQGVKVSKNVHAQGVKVSTNLHVQGVNVFL